MPVRVHASRELGLIRVQVDGILTAKEIADRLLPLVERPEYSLLPLLLFDASGAERVDASSEFIRQQTQRVGTYVDGRIGPGSKMAIVATRDELFGLGRMYEMVRGGSPVAFRVFRELEEAERWLGLSDGYDERLQAVRL